MAFQRCVRIRAAEGTLGAASFALRFQGAQSQVCLRPNVQETKEEVKVGSQRPGDDYFSGAGNAKAIPFGQNKFGVHVRKPSSILCVCVGVFLRHTQLGLSRLNENHVFLGSG